MPTDNASVISLLKRASRPFKQFEVDINGQKFTFYTRSLSALEADKLSKVFGEEFEKAAIEMESGSVDTAMIKRNLARQSKEKLCRLIVNADRADFLAEASSELDDKAFNDPKVEKLADEKAEEAYEKLLTADEESTLEQALERRAFIVASLKATHTQNLNFLFYSLYSDPDVRAFGSPEEIGQELDPTTIGTLIGSIYAAQRGITKIDPLPIRRSTRQKRHTSSPANSEAESAAS